MKPRQWPVMEQEGGGEGGGGGGEGGGDDGAAKVLEERATRMGWSPKDQFKGDPARWVDAATYVKNGEESLPILRERMRKLETSVAEKDKALTDFRVYHEKTEERAYARAKKELEAQIKAAAKGGDEEGAAAAAEELAKVEADHATAKAAPKPDPEWDSWISENRWCEDDAELKEEATVEAFRLRQRMASKQEPLLEGRAFLDKVKGNLKARFPAKFGGNPRRQQGSSVENPGGGGGGESRGGKKGWDQLPPDAKAAGDSFIKQKLFKDKAAYAADYWSQEATT